MTSYEKIINALESIAIGLIPNGQFVHGPLVDASVTYKGKLPLIHCLPFTTNEDDDGVWDSATIILGFWVQDKPASTPVEKKMLIAAMASLSKQYTTMLKEYNGMSVRGIIKEPQYKHYMATLTGYAVRFTIQVVDDCDDSWDYETTDFNNPDYDASN